MRENADQNNSEYGHFSHSVSNMGLIEKKFSRISRWCKRTLIHSASYTIVLTVNLEENKEQLSTFWSSVAITVQIVRNSKLGNRISAVIWEEAVRPYNLLYCLQSNHRFYHQMVLCQEFDRSDCSDYCFLFRFNSTFWSQIIAAFDKYL